MPPVYYSCLVPDGPLWLLFFIRGPFTTSPTKTLPITVTASIHCTKPVQNIYSDICAQFLLHVQKVKYKCMWD